MGGDGHTGDAAQKHHSDVNSSVLIHIRMATPTTWARPKTTTGRRLETKSEPQHAIT